MFHSIVCCVCSVKFGMDSASYDTLKRSAGVFCCPFGHEQHFARGPSEADKLRQERGRLAQKVAEREDAVKRAHDRIEQEKEARQAAERRASAARGQTTKLKNRVAAGLCPCCNRSFQNLSRHMTTQHPGYSAEKDSSHADA